MKRNFLKTWLMLVCLLVGVGSSWATETAYVMSTYSSVNSVYSATDNQTGGWNLSGKCSSSNQLPADWTQTGASSRGICFSTPNNVTVTSQNSFSNVTKIVVEASSNIGSGTGTIAIEVGTSSLGSQNLTKTNHKTYEFTSATPLTGAIKLTVTQGANSVWIGGFTVTTSAGGTNPEPTTVSAPTFSPAAGTYSSAQNVTITAADFDYIYYTTDGTSPIDGAGLQIGERGQNVTVAVASSMTIKAVAYKGTNVSSIAEAAYVISAAPQKTLSSIAVTAQPTKTTYTVGDALDLTGCVVTATYSDNSTENVTSSCTFAPANGATLSTEGTQTVTVSYEGKSTSFNVTVNAAQTPEPASGYVLVTALNQLKVGSKVIIACTSKGKVASSAAATYLTQEDGTFNGDKTTCTPSANTMILTLGKENENWTFADNTGKLLGATAAKSIKFDATDAVNTWTITIANTGVATITNTTAANGTMKYNASSPRFTTYASGQTDIQLFVEPSNTPEEPEKEVASIAVTGTPATLWTGDEFSHEGITVTATYTDETTGDVTAKATFEGFDNTTAGNQTVTVSFGGKQTTYSVTVSTIANTQETAYTIARAKELIDAGNGLKEKVYVAGKISQIDSYSDQYKSITYWISADGTTTDQFKVYGGLNLNNTEFAAQSDIVLGADVVIYGVIKKYSSTYEFDKNNYLVSYTAPVVKTKPELSFAKPSVTAYLDALDEFEALTVITNPAGLTGVQYATSDDTKATVNAATGVVTINNETTPGTVTITASFAETEDYAAADDASYIINIVANKPISVKRAVVAEHDGKYYAMTTTYDNKKMTAVEVSIVENKVVYTGEEDITWNWTATEANKGTLETEEGVGLAKTGTGTDIRLNDGTYTTTVWTIDGTKGLLDEVSARPLLTNGDVWGSYAASNLGKADYSTKASLMEIAEVSTINVSAAGYATYAPAKDVTIMEDEVVYYASAVSHDAITFTALAAGTKIAAGEGLLIKGEGEHAFVATTNATEIEGNKLIGVLEDKDMTALAGSAYILAMDNGAAAFCPVTGGTLAAGKAYLVRPAAEGEAAGPMRITFVTDEVTAVENVEANEAVKFFENGILYIQKNGRVYNAMGQLVK